MERIFRKFVSIKQQKLQRKVQYHSFSLKRIQVDAQVAAEARMKEGRALLKSMGLTKSTHSPRKIPHLHTWHLVWFISQKIEIKKSREMWTWDDNFAENRKMPRSHCRVFWVTHINYRHKANWVFLFQCQLLRASFTSCSSLNQWSLTSRNSVISSSSLCWQTGRAYISHG